MKKVLGVLALLLLLPAWGQAEMDQPPEEGPPSLVLPEGASIMPASLSGESLSPDGRFMAVERGQGEPAPAAGVYPAQVSPADMIQITDAQTGEVLWEGEGAYSQFIILWSPEGSFAALARTSRTRCSVTVIETENWTSWDFTLPDGSPIPEYTFLPDDEPWCVWREYEGCFDLTLGRGGDERSKMRYYCVVSSTNGEIEGYSWREDREILSEDYDFDHDGTPEPVELITIFGENGVSAGGYTLRIWKEDGTPIWVQNTDLGHASWCSVFAFEQDGRDYLLRYNPTMYQGFATYSYTLFSLSEFGEEQAVREGSVNFDLNFGSPMHEGYDPKAIAAFLEEVHGLLENSELLLTTEGGVFRTGGSGADFRSDMDFWIDDLPYDGGKTLEENLRNLRDSLQKAAG